MNKNNDIGCIACGVISLSKNEIGLNKKLLGRKIKQFYCLSCLADFLTATTDELLAKVEEFREQGCVLF